MDIKTAIKQKAIDLGFDLIGITDSSEIPPQHAQILHDWLNKGLSGSMAYMTRNLEKRLKPQKLFKNTASIICLGLIYKPDFDTSAPAAGLCRVSDYAVYNDYHDYMKSQLKLLASHLHTLAEPKTIRTKVCVDTAPVAERSLAARASLGFIGKNHMLINPELGAEIFLGEIFSDFFIEPDAPINTDCGNCSRCIDSCPTGALSPNGTLDTQKCISYLTIEHKDEIPTELKPKIANRLYGCDTCVHACPYHQNAPVRKNTELTPHPENIWFNPNDILTWNQQTFDQRFTKTPIQRIGLDKLKQNAKICSENI